MEGDCQQSALHLSVRFMALSAIHILASYGADVNAVDSCGMTPLHMAVGILHKDIMASLIKEGADVNMVRAVPLLLFIFFGSWHLLYDFLLKISKMPSPHVQYTVFYKKKCVFKGERF